MPQGEAAVALHHVHTPPHTTPLAHANIPTTRCCCYATVRPAPRCSILRIAHTTQQPGRSEGHTTTCAPHHTTPRTHASRRAGLLGTGTAHMTTRARRPWHHRHSRGSSRCRCCMQARALAHRPPATDSHTCVSRGWTDRQRAPETHALYTLYCILGGCSTKGSHRKMYDKTPETTPPTRRLPPSLVALTKRRAMHCALYYAAGKIHICICGAARAAFLCFVCWHLAAAARYVVAAGASNAPSSEGQPACAPQNRATTRPPPRPPFPTRRWHAVFCKESYAYHNTHYQCCYWGRNRRHPRNHRHHNDRKPPQPFRQPPCTLSPYQTPRT